MANFVVTTLNDELDSSNQSATLDDFGGEGDLSLREALALANANADADTITFAANLSSGTLFLTRGELTITSNLAIDGDVNNDGTADITMSADSAAGADDATSRVLSISDGADSAIAVTLHGLTIRDGSGIDGGGVLVGVADQLTVRNTTVTDNATIGRGGGIFGHEHASIQLEGSTVSDNHSGISGGGVFVATQGTIDAVNTTIAGNAAGGNGGGLYGFATNNITLINVTLTGNSSAVNGGGVNVANLGDGDLTFIANSIIAGNQAAGVGDDLFNQVAGEALLLAGGNIFGSIPVNFTSIGSVPVGINGSNSAALQTVFADVALVDPDGAGDNAAFHAGVLGDNGGPVATVALRATTSNLALDGGRDDVAPPTDARGFLRVDVPDVAHSVANVSDIGAFELQGPFEADSLVVTTLADVVDIADGLISLREALAFANSDPGADTITFADGLIGGTLYLAEGELAITSDVTIDGDIDNDGIADITISADSAAGADDATGRVFLVADGAASTIAATLHGLRIRDGVTLDGGAIAVGVGDRLTLTNTTVSDNTAFHSGGAIWMGDFSLLRLEGSTLSGNHAAVDGGGVYARRQGAVEVVNATIANNSAGEDGGGIYGFDHNFFALVNATLTGNSAGGDGGGIYTYNQPDSFGQKGFTTLTNSIIAGNAAGDLGDDFYNELSNGDLIFAGGNIIGSAPVNLTQIGPAPVTIDGASQAALESVFGDVTLIDPDGAGGSAAFHAGVLGDNGGPVATVALRAAVTNPALDGGGDSLAPASDARGFGRVDVAGAAHNVANVSDIGAFELHGPFEAGSFVVTTLDDAVDPFDGLTSLREALAFANSNPDDNTITFAENLAGGTLYLADGELAITSDVTIEGDVDHDGAADITISADSAAGADDATSSVFSISDGADTSIFVALRSLQIRDGHGGNGGAIVLGVADQLYLRHTTVSDSTASASGGAIWLDRNGSVALDASMVWNNRAGFDGGGIAAAQGGTVELLNTTVAGNAAAGAGGGIFGFTANVIALANATVTGNSAGTHGGGIATANAAEGTTSITNSIVAGNRAALGNDLHNAGARDDLFLTGGNILGSSPVNLRPIGTGTVTIDGASRTALQTVFADVALVDPDGTGGNPGFWAGIPADHGGPVATVALRAVANNPALDAGTDVFAASADARGLDRVDVAIATHNGANVSDLGAFELQGPFEAPGFVVTTLDDGSDLFDGLTSLREALALANSNPDGNTITFAPELSGGTVYLTQGELAITAAVTIEGDIGHDGTADITISADSAPGADDATSRVFAISHAAGSTMSVGLSGLHIRDGFADNGGAIRLGAGDQLTLTNTTVADNMAFHSGGGVWTEPFASLVLDRSTVSDNHAAREGGGIYLHNTATVGVANSTIAENSAGADGGGIYGWYSNAMTLVNATVTGNSAGDDGGGIYSANTNGYFGQKGFTSIANSIIAGNAAAGQGDDLYNAPNSFTLTPGDLEFLGGNIIGSDPVGFAQTGTAPITIDGSSRTALQTVFAEVALVDPDGAGGNSAFHAGALDDNGGSVDTVAIRTNGLAHDAGGNAALPLDSQDLDGDGVTNEPLPFDARGLARVINGVVDIGAFEIQNSDPTAVFNHGLTVDEGASGAIEQAALFFIDAEETDITYTITALPVSGTLFLAGTALGVNDTFTQADVNQGRLSYTHDGGDTSADSFSFQVSDGVGGQADGLFQVSVNGLNDAPGGNVAGGAIQYVEDQAPTALDPTLTVTDPDDTHLEGARVAITGNFAAGQDVLGFTPQPGISGSYDAATGVLTLTGTATLAQYEAALRSVTYHNTSQNPSGAARTVSFQVDDGGGLAGFGSVGVTVVPELDAPNDINADHTSDIVLRTEDGTVALWEMNGTAVLSNTAIATIPTHWHIIDADSDFTGDGRSDILWRDTAGTVVLWEMDGPAILSNTDLGTFAAYWHIEDTGDFTGDGRADILWRDDAGRVVLWEMNGPTIVNNSLVADVPITSHIEDTADVTGDGRNDILWRDEDGTLRIWEMNGANLVSDTTIGVVAAGRELVGTGDFNRDQRFDLLWRDDDGTVTLWEMSGATIVGDTVLATLPDHWSIADIGDYTGDLASDILWRDTQGTIVLWEMDGAMIVGNTAVNTIPTHWHIVA